MPVESTALASSCAVGVTRNAGNRAAAVRGRALCASRIAFGVGRGEDARAARPRA